MYSRQFWSGTIRHGLDMLIEELLGMYDSAVEQNEQMAFFELFEFFLSFQ